MKIAVLTPTRQRPERRKKFHDSVIDNAENHQNISMYYYIDSDDPALEEYANQTLVHPALDTVGEPMSISRSWNIIAEKAIADGADILIMGNDDLVYETYGWDIRLLEVVKTFPDNIYCIWFNDKLKKGSHCAFPIISKEWYNCLGYYTPGHFNFGYNDTWIYNIAQRLNRCKYIDDIVMWHDQNKISGKFDETSLRIYRGPKGNLYSLDAMIWKTSGQKLNSAVKKLEKFIYENRNL